MRSEKAELQKESIKDSSDSIESSDFKDSMDCHANPYGLSRNDERRTNSHKALNSRNDEVGVDLQV